LLKKKDKKERTQVFGQKLWMETLPSSGNSKKLLRKQLTNSRVKFASGKTERYSFTFLSKLSF
jgi:hypothetical protein